MAKLVPNICVSVPNEPEDMEAECQESGAKQVPQSSQVRDGEVVGVQAPAPHPVHHPVCDVQQNQHLRRQKGSACSRPLSAGGARGHAIGSAQWITRLGRSQPFCQDRSQQARGFLN